MLRTVVAVASLLVASSGAPAQTATPQTPAETGEVLALLGATLHAGDASEPLVGAVVLVQQGKITAIAPPASIDIPAGARRIDLAGKHLTPGLIDTHVHYSQTGWVDGRPDATDLRAEFPYETAMAESRLHPERLHRAFLHAGVTAVFDVGGYPWTLALQQATEADVLAPHVVATGPLLATWDPGLSLPDARQFLFPQTAEEGRTLVAAHAKAGSAAIKFWYIPRGSGDVARWSPVLAAIGAQCRESGLPLVVHATSLAAAKDAVAAGASLLVHSVEEAVVDDDFLAAMKAGGTSYCPTLTVRAGYAAIYAAEVPEDVRRHLDDVHPTVKDRVLRTTKLPPRNARVLAGMSERMKLQGNIMAQNVRKLRDAGVPIVLGTDAGNPLTLHGPSVFTEMRAMVEAGMTPREVLVAATSAAARAIGRGRDLGLLATGRIADLLVLDRDPERDVDAFRGLTHVMRGGELHERRATLPR